MCEICWLYGLLDDEGSATMNLTEAIQSEISAIDRPFIRAALQRRFDRRPQAFVEEVQAQMFLRGNEHVQAAMMAGPNVAIDPETLAFLKEVFEAILPLLLALLF